MSKQPNRYQQMERYMCMTLALDLVLFVVYLISAGSGIVWMKVICAILAILISGLCLAFLYLTNELLRERSLWMTVSAAAIAICTIFSLILNFPSPNPFA